jgi:gluconolactonase
VETLAFGFGLAEAPLADDRGGVLFSDVLGGGVNRWSREGGVEVVLPKRRGIGGLVLHADGGIVVSGRDLVHVRGDETRTLLAAPEGVTGLNDMAADAAGRVYVGALRFKPFAGETPVPGEVWRIDAEGRGLVLFDGIDWPNGIGFSPDGGTIYTSDFASGQVLAHDLGADGQAIGRRVFAQSPAGADGLAVDSEGSVWVALGQGGGVARFQMDGSLEQVLDVPASFVSSVCFGGADLCDLYITTADNSEDSSRAGTLFRARVEVPGLPRPAATV